MADTAVMFQATTLAGLVWVGPARPSWSTGLIVTVTESPAAKWLGARVGRSLLGTTTPFTFHV